MQQSMLRCVSKSFNSLQITKATATSSYCRLIHIAALSRQKPADRAKGNVATTADALVLAEQPKILKLYEPDYLDPKGHRIPTYDLVNLRIQGYDYPVLERFESFVHRTAERIGLDVEDCWGVPSQKLQITRLKHETTVVDAEYQLNIYERTVQIGDVPATMLPIFISIVQSALPVGVTLTVKEHEKADEEVRYIPDLELKELKEQLQEDGTALKKKKIRVKISSKFRRTATPPKNPIHLL